MSFARASAVALLITTPRIGFAQCADGSPPPCPVRRVAIGPAPAPAIDANRVAILPFRVTTSDTLLGEGFAELLASEFTGQGMPRAVDMGTALQAWQRAGGRSRTPLNRAQTLQVARSLGAGIVSEGSIVGLGRQITISAALLTVPDGRPRGATARVTVSADSLDYALRRVAALLTGTADSPATVVVSDDARYTNSPEALRDYLEGMALWRKGKLGPAADAWDRAIARDSLFARAMYRRLLAQSWSIPGRVRSARVFELRDRLSTAEQTLIVALYGQEYGAKRSVERHFGDRDRAVFLLPDNADALYTAGDFWYHSGSAMDATEYLQRSVEYLGRAAAIDSQATVLQHLAEAAYRLRDTAFMRRTVEAYARTDSRSRWQISWLTAARLGDERWLARLRTEKPDSNFYPAPFLLGAIAGAPARVHDEMMERWLAVSNPDSRTALRHFRAIVLLAHGRPAAAESSWAVSTLPADFRAYVDRLRLGLTLGNVLDVNLATIEQRLRDETATDSASVISRKCLLTALALRRGMAVPVDTTGFGRFASHCAFAIEVLRIPFDSGAVTERALARADSSLRDRVLVTSNSLQGYEAALMAEAWEKAGHPARALNATRYRQSGYGPGESPWNFAEEGRLAAIVGDTVGARRAITIWLEIMQGAEPVYDERRARVRTALARLERKPVP